MLLRFIRPFQFSLPPCTTIAIHQSLVEAPWVQGRNQDLEGGLPMASVCVGRAGVQSKPLSRGVWGLALPENVLEKCLSQVVSGGGWHLKVSFRID